MDAKTENRNQITAMLFQNMSKNDAADTLTLIDNYVDKCQKSYASQQMLSDFEIITDEIIHELSKYMKANKHIYEPEHITDCIQQLRCYRNAYLKSLQQEKSNQ